MDITNHVLQLFGNETKATTRKRYFTTRQRYFTGVSDLCFNETCNVKIYYGNVFNGVDVDHIVINDELIIPMEDIVSVRTRQDSQSYFDNRITLDKDRIIDINIETYDLNISFRSRDFSVITNGYSGPISEFKNAILTNVIAKATFI